MAKTTAAGGLNGGNRGKPKKCGIYMRVSTREADTSLKAQERALRKYVKRRNAKRGPGEQAWRVVGKFEDRASGKFKNQPGLAEALEDARRGKLDVLVVLRLDRIGRSLLGAVRVLPELRSYGCAVVSVADPHLDGTRPHGEFMLQLLTLLAEYERAAMSERARAAWRLRRSRDA